MDNKTIGIILGVCVAIMLVGSVLMPIIGGVSGGSIEVSNDINRPATLIDDSDDVNIVMELGYSTPSIKLNGVALERDTDVTWYYVVASDGFSIVYNWLDSNPFIVHNNYGQSVSMGISTVVTEDMTITITKSNINIAYGSYSFDRSFTWLSYYDPAGSGDYQNYFSYAGMPDKRVYFKDVNELRGASTKYFDSYGLYYAFVGDNVRLNPNNDVNEAGTTTATIVSERYLYSDINVLDFGRDDGGYTFEYDSTTINTWSLVVPTEIEGYNEPLGNGTAILMAVPLVLLAAILVIFVKLPNRW